MKIQRIVLASKFPNDLDMEDGRYKISTLVDVALFWDPSQSKLMKSLVVNAS